MDEKEAALGVAIDTAEQLRQLKNLVYAMDIHPDVKTYMLSQITGSHDAINSVLERLGRGAT